MRSVAQVEDLAKLAIQGVPVYVGVGDDDTAATVATLEQVRAAAPLPRQDSALGGVSSQVVESS